MRKVNRFQLLEIKAFMLDLSKYFNSALLQVSNNENYIYK